MSEELNLKPTSMFTITAKLMNHVIDSVEESFGGEGLALLHEGIVHFISEQKNVIKQGKESYELNEKAMFTYERLLDEDQVEQTYKNFAYDQDQAKVEQPVSIYAMMAKVFGHVTKAIVDKYGEEGKTSIKQGVWDFGEERGNNIAERAASAGRPNTTENYLPHYDMGRSDLFEIETINHPDKVEQTFTACAFGDQWKADGMGEYGILYCQMIDPAIAKGYHPDFDVIHDEYILQEGQCHFLFQMNKDKDKKQ